MSSDNPQLPVGTIVREDHKHTDGSDGQTTWVLVQDHATVADEVVETYPTWVVLFSTSIGNLAQTLDYDELPQDTYQVIGVIPGTPADEAEKVVKGDYPRITWGTKPDGSPWAVHVDFGSGVAINSTGGIWDNKRAITAAQADRKSIALREAMSWVVNDMVSVAEGNKAHQLATGEQPKRKPKKTRIAVDKRGYLYTWGPREDRLRDLTPWMREALTDGGHRVHSSDTMVTELTDADSITVTEHNGDEVASFMGGTRTVAFKRSDLFDVNVPGDGKVGLQLLTRVYRTEDTFYVLHKGASLFIPVRRGA